jgi:hypothetical protein
MSIVAVEGEKSKVVAGKVAAGKMIMTEFVVKGVKREVSTEGMVR